MQDKQEPLHTLVRKDNINISTFYLFYVESDLLNLKEGSNRDEAQFEKMTKMEATKQLMQQHLQST